MTDDGRYIHYSLGLITSVEFKSYNELRTREPILWIKQQMSRPRAQIESKTNFKFGLEFTVPIDYLDTPTQCERWIESKLKLIGLQRVASETANPKVLLRKLVWKMKKKPEAGEVYTGVVEISVSREVERQAEFNRRTVEASVRDMSGKFKGGKDSCCAICLDVMVGNGAVVELPCCHVFHRRCIEDWVNRKTNCPCCRSSVNLISGFWVHIKNRDDPRQ